MSIIIPMTRLITDGFGQINVVIKMLIANVRNARINQIPLDQSRMFVSKIGCLNNR
jgi:hypothetical protein